MRKRKRGACRSADPPLNEARPYGARGEDRAGAASPPPPQSGTPSSTSASSGVPDWTVDWGPRGPPPGKAAASPEPLLGPAGVRVPDLLSLRPPEAAEAGATPVGN